MIINGQRYEAEPAVKVIIDKLTIENAELKAENARLEEGYQKSVGVIAATDCVKCKKDAEPVKHGHWIDTPLDRYKKFESKCSECGWHGISNYDSYVDIYEFEYCPYCGAKMDGGADDD